MLEYTAYFRVKSIPNNEKNSIFSIKMDISNIQNRQLHQKKILKELEGITSARDYCEREQITLDELYELINNVEDEIPDKNLTKSTLPEFILNVLSSNIIRIEGKKTFMRRFGYRYIRSEMFRNITYNCSLLFIDRDYKGTYPTFEECQDKAMELYPGDDKFRHIISMFVEEIYR